MTTIRQLLDQKGKTLCSISPNASVFDAIAKMAEQDVGSLLVMDGDKLVGIITERLYARNVALKGKTSPKIPVQEIMERDVIVALPENSVEECMALMTEKRVRHLPVVENGKPIGIVSIGDLVKRTSPETGAGRRFMNPCGGAWEVGRHAGSARFLGRRGSAERTFGRG